MATKKKASTKKAAGAKKAASKANGLANPEPPLSKGELRLEFVAFDENMARDFLRFVDEGDAAGYWLVLEPHKALSKTRDGQPRFQVRLRPEELSITTPEDMLDDDDDDAADVEDDFDLDDYPAQEDDDDDY